MAPERSFRWLLVALTGLSVAACGGKAHSSSSAGGVALPDAGGSRAEGATDPVTEQGGAGGASATLGAAGYSAGGAAGYSAGGAAGAASGPTAPTPSPCVFDSEVEAGLQRCTNGLVHRTAAVSCPSLLPLPDPVLPGVDDIPDASYAFGCRRDRDCTEHPYGHCLIEPGLPHCEYGCVVDADCPQDQLCSCQSYGGRCISATCRTDGDCGTRLCTSYTECSGTVFTCQTPFDLCTGDSDCPERQRCVLRPIDSSDPNSFLRRVCREGGACAASTGAP